MESRHARLRGERYNQHGDAMSNPAEVLAVLAGHLPELHTHAVSGLWVFGSAARGELRPDSDSDISIIGNGGLPEPMVLDAAGVAESAEGSLATLSAILVDILQCNLTDLDDFRREVLAS